ncbi:hypothetical protein DAPPUDRAFT_238422 [Daphnia pulex]|uniref:Uncharacterized protein n=1 Tax=Daphnia pulex TaxID=6669 RepID=E9G6C9_DAPPU|nr:hypothetical protein DAPPUDRAFT_238422 [Daphnia pulex]|eukprot:EFX84912.1 hypothetical protein DAPPUDRAFT_238422 [Daphnia pulex]
MRSLGQLCCWSRLLIEELITHSTLFSRFEARASHHKLKICHGQFSTSQLCLWSDGAVAVKTFDQHGLKLSQPMLQVCVVAAVPAIEQSPTKPHHHRSLWKRAFLLSASQQQQQQRHIDQAFVKFGRWKRRFSSASDQLSRLSRDPKKFQPNLCSFIKKK